MPLESEGKFNLHNLKTFSKIINAEVKIWPLIKRDSKNKHRTMLLVTVGIIVSVILLC